MTRAVVEPHGEMDGPAKSELYARNCSLVATAGPDNKAMFTKPKIAYLKCGILDLLIKHNISGRINEFHRLQSGWASVVKTNFN